MKLSRFIVFCLVATTVVACSMSSESNSTPQLSFTSLPVTNNNDTLKLYSTSTSGVYRMDTMTVGDTATFKIYVDGYYNHIRYLSLTQYSDSSTRIIMPRKTMMDSLFLSTSNISKGQLISTGTYYSFPFTFKYVARKASKEAKLTFYLSSDANFEYNYSGFDIGTPIKDKK